METIIKKITDNEIENDKYQIIKSIERKNKNDRFKKVTKRYISEQN